MSADDLAGVRVGLLHTVPSLAGTFQSAIAAAAPGIDLVHIADAALLETAIRIGVTDAVRRRVAQHIGYLADVGAAGVLVTCSSIGEAVEAAAAQVDVPVLRVDAAMAEEAVTIAQASGRAAGRPGVIRVLATLQATLGPTGRLIERRASDAQVTSSVVAGAIAARDSGDQASHDRLIAEAVEKAAGDADVIVLAQASMAAAAAGVKVGVPVLTSPESGVAALLSALRATPQKLAQ
jgi:aspartate/glutamate racemase